MAGSYRQPEGGDWSAAAESGAPSDTDAAELIAQIRHLAADADPAGVRQVVADVLSALDRAAGGALRQQLPNGLPSATGYAEPSAGYADPLADLPAGYADPPVDLPAGYGDPPVDLPAGYGDPPVDLPVGVDEPVPDPSEESDDPPADPLTGHGDPPVALSDLEAAGSEQRPTESG
jgi:hypothetical protein